MHGAVEHLEEIPKEAQEFQEAQSTLAQIYKSLAQRYEALGNQEKNWQGAREWFEKSQAMSMKAQAIGHLYKVEEKPKTGLFHTFRRVFRRNREIDA